VGFDVGDQALENLRAVGRVTACQPPNLLPLTFKHGGSAAPGTDVLTAGNSSWLGEGDASLGQGQQVRAHLLEHCQPVVEEVVELRVAFGQYVICNEIICIHHTLTLYILIHSIKHEI
jgi:hypothetical protein